MISSAGREKSNRAADSLILPAGIKARHFMDTSSVSPKRRIGFPTSASHSPPCSANQGLVIRPTRHRRAKSVALCGSPDCRGEPRQHAQLHDLVRPSDVSRVTIFASRTRRAPHRHARCAPCIPPRGSDAACCRRRSRRPLRGRPGAYSSVEQRLALGRRAALQRGRGAPPGHPIRAGPSGSEQAERLGTGSRGFCGWRSRGDNELNRWRSYVGPR
jgi:hypothetical protein